ncbi:UNVERIFIED_CONTAM: hypothetical protein K2H54_015645 [Gekko kuhli]
MAQLRSLNADLHSLALDGMLSVADKPEQETRMARSYPINIFWAMLGRGATRALKDLLCSLVPLLLHLHDESPTTAEAYWQALPSATILLGHRKLLQMARLSHHHRSPFPILLRTVGSARNFGQSTGGSPVKGSLLLVLGPCPFGPIGVSKEDLGVFPKPTTDVWPEDQKGDSLSFLRYYQGVQEGGALKGTGELLEEEISFRDLRTPLKGNTSSVPETA